MAKPKDEKKGKKGDKNDEMDQYTLLDDECGGKIKVLKATKGPDFLMTYNVQGEKSKSKTNKKFFEALDESDDLIYLNTKNQKDQFFVEYIDKKGSKGPLMVKLEYISVDIDGPKDKHNKVTQKCFEGWFITQCVDMITYNMQQQGQI